MTICVSRPQADSFTGHAKNVTFLQLTDLITDDNWLSSRNSFQGAKSIVMQNFCCFRTKFQERGGAKVPEGVPPVEKGQASNSVM